MQENENIIKFKKQTLFKNAFLIDFATQQTRRCDILVEGDKFAAIEDVGSFENFNGKIVDLEGNYVLPPFKNMFCDSIQAFENTYQKEFAEIKDISAIKSGLSNYSKNSFYHAIGMLFMQKCIMAGCFEVKDMAFEKLNIPLKKRLYCLQHIEDLSEKELDEICLKLNAENFDLNLKIGQSLDELGSVDKLYKKPISQVLEDFGFLDLSPTIVGGNCLEKDELQLLKPYGCKFVITPNEDARCGRRPTNVISLKMQDFDIGIGSGYSFEVDFFDYMRQILSSMRSLFEDANCLSEKEVLQMATGQSGDENLIDVGKDASFIVIHKELSFYNSIFKTLVYEKSNKDVLMLVGKGIIIKKDDEFFMNMQQYYDIIKVVTSLVTRSKKQ